MQYGFGVDLGGTTVKLAFFDREGNLLDKWEIPTDTGNGGDRILPDIAGAIRDYIREKNIEKASLLGIGMGVPGPVLPGGTVNGCVNLGWGKRNVRQELETLTGLPVCVENDASLAALGEAWMGSGQGCGDLVMITLGTGVGSGIVLGGKLLSGAYGAAGEIGHMILNTDEKTDCVGGRGCGEQYCSATGIVNTAKRLLAQSEEASCLHNAEPLTCKAVFDAASAGDPVASRVLEQTYSRLGQLIAGVCCVINPARVILGGGVSKAGQPLLDGVQRAFDDYAFPPCKPVEFVLARLGNDAGAYGAFRLLLK